MIRVTEKLQLTLLPLCNLLRTKLETSQVHVFSPVAGIGVGMLFITAQVVVFYNMILGWALFYTAVSFENDLPFSLCDHSFNTPCKFPFSYLGKLHDNIVKSRPGEFLGGLRDALNEARLSLSGCADFGTFLFEQRILASRGFFTISPAPVSPTRTMAVAVLCCQFLWTFTP